MPDTPRLYVGTYAKYNSGSIAGAWLNLEDYSDRDAFLEACAELHKDEEDPELMFQDFEGFPRSYYSESSAPPDELWDWIDLDDRERDMVAAYRDGINESASVDDIRDAFSGTFDSEANWAENFLDETGGLEGVPEHLKNYIDFAAYGRDARLGGDMDFVRFKGDLYAFHNI